MFKKVSIFSKSYYRFLTENENVYFTIFVNSNFKYFCIYEIHKTTKKAILEFFNEVLDLDFTEQTHSCNATNHSTLLELTEKDLFKIKLYGYDFKKYIEAYKFDCIT